MNCTIPNTHKRLNEAHFLWHQCLEHYFNPEGFRVSLNATIQAMRNLTFALQAEKENIGGFESWYAVWQTKMKSNSVMKWLNEARVQIVHQRDLETKSIADVLIHSYHNLFEFRIGVPSHISSNVIARVANQVILENIAPQGHQLHECIALIERKWVVDELPEWELLDALAHCFLLLKDIVIDAHQQTGLDMEDCQCIDTVHSLITPEFKEHYECMDNVASMRRQNIMLGNYQSRRVEMHPVKMSTDIVDKATKRYLSKPIPDFSEKQDLNPLDFANQINTLAKSVLVRDKFHQSIFFVLIPEVGWQLIGSRPDDKSDKFIIMKELAEYVRKHKAQSVLHVGEVWLSYDVEELERGIPVSETKNKKEALQVVVTTSTGQTRDYVTVFSRGYFGGIKLEETVVSEGSVINYFNPIVEVWKEMRSREN